jgi:peptidoglycan/LPS O-acetylase OafA/YrhL
MLARWPRLAMPAAAGTLAMFLFLLATPGFRDDVLLPVLTKTGSYALHQTGIGTMPLTMHGLLDNLFWRPWFLTPDFGKIYNGVLWTMYIELSGSFIAMTLSIVGATMAWRLNSILLVGLVAAVLLFAAPPGYGIYFALFLAGTAIAAIDPPIRVRQGRARTLMLGLFFLGLLLGGYNGTGLSAAFSFLFVQSNIIPGGVLIMGVGAVLVFWTVLTDETVAGWFRARPMRYLGRVSFALYLFHVIVILAIGVPAFALLPDNWPVELRGLAASAIVLVLAIALSEIMTRAVDEPSVAFSRRLARLFVP